ncbi:MAG: TIGR01777 family oxidoreductase [Planctomycetia bacterium]|nr:TIGR01777 family oxidoreductase [Planctomycetia bacterium]
MAPGRFEATARFDVPVEELWAWHARPGAFERLAPPWDRVEVLHREGTVEDGVLVMKVPGPPGMRRWRARMCDADPGRRFVDVMEAGPFRAWRHEHHVAPDGPGASVLRDAIRYAMPFPPFGGWFGGAFVRRMLVRLFRFRHARTRDDLARHARFAALPRRRVAVTGASGFVGRALVPFLTTGGHDVVPLVRGGGPGVAWDPKAGTLDTAALGAVDAVVHLAGAPVAAGRWNAARKAEILASRVEGTATVARALARLPRRPEVLVVASAVGVYGDRGDEMLDEDAATGDGFLADVGRAWEAAAAPARDAGIRVVHARFGVVLGAAGGALARMRRPFAFGLGGPLGDGRAFVPWVALDDAVGAVHHAILTPGLEGPVNVVAPAPVRWRELATTLGAVLRRPAVLRMPRALARLAFGEMADAVLLPSQRVVPARLAASGFRWARPDLDDALRHELGRPPAPVLRARG